MGTAPAMEAAAVDAAARRAAVAQRSWAATSFAQRRRVLRTLQRYLVGHADELCRTCAADSGKTRVDALLGEVLTTCEKVRSSPAFGLFHSCPLSLTPSPVVLHLQARTLLRHGEEWLAPSRRPVPPLMLHKRAMVE